MWKCSPCWNGSPGWRDLFCTNSVASHCPQSNSGPVRILFFKAAVPGLLVTGLFWCAGATSHFDTSFSEEKNNNLDSWITFGFAHLGAFIWSLNVCLPERIKWSFHWEVVENTASLGAVCKLLFDLIIITPNPVRQMRAKFTVSPTRKVHLKVQYIIQTQSSKQREAEESIFLFSETSATRAHFQGTLSHLANLEWSLRWEENAIFTSLLGFDMNPVSLCLHVCVCVFSLSQWLLSEELDSPSIFVCTATQCYFSFVSLFF